MEQNSKYGTIDKSTLEKLQVLSQFVDFVAGLDETSPEHKSNAEKVKYNIENLDKPETFKFWSVCLELIDYGISFRSNAAAVYIRNWWIIWDAGIFYVESKSILKKRNPFDEDFHFQTQIVFKDNQAKIYGDSDFTGFVEDAMNFRKHITKDLNEIETEIDI